MRTSVGRWLILILLVMCGPAGAETRKPFDHATLALTALDQHIQPGYARLASAAIAMAQPIARHCQTPTARLRKAVDRAFDDLVTAWGRVEHITFGPVTVANRYERLFFWPDRQGIAARQLDRLIAARDPSAIEPEALARKSIAIQGIGALERALFPTKSAPKPDAAERDYRCRLAAALAANIARTATDVRQAWSAPEGFRLTWLEPGPNNPTYASAAETTLELAKAYDRAIEIARDERIAGPLALNSKGKKFPIVFAASGRTTHALAANIDAALELFTAGGLQQAVVATNTQHANINVEANSSFIAGELRKSSGIANGLLTVRQPFASIATQNRLIRMGFPLKTARIQTAALLTLTAGLTLGFNSSDGD